jgi:hypothetical protein
VQGRGRRPADGSVHGVSRLVSLVPALGAVRYRLNEDRCAGSILTVLIWTRTKRRTFVSLCYLAAMLTVPDISSTAIFFCPPCTEKTGRYTVSEYKGVIFTRTYAYVHPILPLSYCRSSLFFSSRPHSSMPRAACTELGTLFEAPCTECPLRASAVSLSASRAPLHAHRGTRHARSV